MDVSEYTPSNPIQSAAAFDPMPKGRTVPEIVKAMAAIVVIVEPVAEQWAVVLPRYDFGRDPKVLTLRPTKAEADEIASLIRARIERCCHDVLCEIAGR